MKAVPICSFLCLLPACGDASKSTTSGSTTYTDGAWTHGRQLTVAGRARSYSLYVPTTGQTSGLMVALHGSGETVDRMITGIAAESVAEENGVIVAVPAGIDQGWNDEEPPSEWLADDVGFIDALVAEIKTDHASLPHDRVFAHGFSNGGGLAVRLACESEQIRGVGVVGNYYVGIFEACSEARDFSMPGWFGAGLEDEVVPVESIRSAMSSYAADLTNCSDTGTLQIIEVEGASDDVVCKQFPGCNDVRLCEYAHRGHEVLPGSFEAAWSFLSSRSDSSTD